LSFRANDIANVAALNTNDYLFSTVSCWWWRNGSAKAIN